MEMNLLLNTKLQSRPTVPDMESFPGVEDGRRLLLSEFCTIGCYPLKPQIEESSNYVRHVVNKEEEGPMLIGTVVND